MCMSQKDLHQLLNELRAELQGLEASSDTHGDLNKLTFSIEQQIEKLDDRKRQISLIENIQILIEKFEVEHPRITSILNDVMMKLMNLGI